MGNMGVLGRRGWAALTVVGVVALDEAPAVDVYDLTPLAAFAAEHVKAADHLPKAVANACGPRLLLVAEIGDEPGTPYEGLCSGGNGRLTYRISLPSVLRRTTPSTNGDLRVSACV